MPSALDWKVISTPWHTTDSRCLWYEKEKTLISCDTILNMDGTGELNRFYCHYPEIKKSFTDVKVYLNVRSIYHGYGSTIRLGNDLLSKVAVLK